MLPVAWTPGLAIYTVADSANLVQPVLQDALHQLELMMKVQELVFLILHCPSFHEKLLVLAIVGDMKALLVSAFVAGLRSGWEWWK